MAVRTTRPVSWLSPAYRDFLRFPDAVRDIALDALSVAAEGGKSAIAKPMHGLGSGVFELALAVRGEAYRVVYAVQLGVDMWVIHAFQKKSKQGSKTPRADIDLVRDRLKRLKGILT